MPRNTHNRSETANVFREQDANGAKKKKTNMNEMKISSKRPANSPAKVRMQKRSAFGDITNVKLQATDKDGRQKIAPTNKNTYRRKSKRNSIKSLPAPVTESKEFKPSANMDTSETNMSCSQESSASSGSTRSFVSAEDTLSEPRDILESPDLPSPVSYEYVVDPSRQQLKSYDHDAANSGNINEAPDYAFVIFEYMRTREQSFVIKPNYLSASQPDVTPDMRAIVVDWMVEIQESFELNHETLYLAVKLLDLYLQSIHITRGRLQLVGSTALLVAAKFDERHPPYVEDFVYICDNTYSRKDVLTMERSLLTNVGFDINVPIAYRFLRRYAKCSKTNMQVLTLARYVLELTLQHYAFVHRSASLLAAASLWLAKKMADYHEWDDSLVYYSTHSEKDIFDLARELNAMCVAAKEHKLQTVRTKYSHSIFYEVAKIDPLSEEKLEEERRRIFADQVLQDDDDKLFIQL